VTGRVRFSVGSRQFSVKAGARALAHFCQNRADMGHPEGSLHPGRYPLHPVLPLCYHPCFRGCGSRDGLNCAPLDRGNPMPEEDQAAGPPARKRCAPGHIPPRFRRHPRRLPDIPVPAVTVGFPAQGIYLPVSVATGWAGFVKYGRLRANGAANLILKTRRCL
jgi:hypothetical protein